MNNPPMRDNTGAITATSCCFILYDSVELKEPEIITGFYAFAHADSEKPKLCKILMSEPCDSRVGFRLHVYIVPSKPTIPDRDFPKLEKFKFKLEEEIRIRNVGGLIDTYMFKLNTHNG